MTGSLLRRALFAALAPLLAAGAAAAQPSPRQTVIDGVLNEWDGPRTAARAERSRIPASAYPRPLGVQVRHDADAVYLLVRLDREVSLQALPGTLALVMDADGDPASGWTAHGVPGVDAVLEFSPVWPGGWRAGAGLRTRSAGEDTTRLVSANAAGVMVAPSHASRVFEMRIPRGGAIPLGGRMTARLLSLDAHGGVADALPAFTVELAGSPPRRPSRGQGAADPLARAPGTQFRVVSWNVGRETIFQQPDAYGAILRALSPDLVILDEVAGGHSAAEVEALLNRHVPGDRPWRVVYGVSGGSQRGVIATRGDAPAVAGPFDRVLPYPDSTRALVPADTVPAALAWLRSRLESHVPATAARVRLGGRTLLAVTMDLEAGGAPGGPPDRLRRIEAHVIHQAIQSVLRGGGVDGVLVAGDLNLVGTPHPLPILTRGLDGRRPLGSTLPLRLDDAAFATWENPAEVFTPSRLDYVLYTRSSLDVAGTFVFRSGDLSPEWRARHGLTDATSAVTDHLPVVTDLRWDGGR